MGEAIMHRPMEGPVGPTGAKGSTGPTGPDGSIKMECKYANYIYSDNNNSYKRYTGNITFNFTPKLVIFSLCYPVNTVNGQITGLLSTNVLSGITGNDKIYPLQSPNPSSNSLLSISGNNVHINIGTTGYKYGFTGGFAAFG